MNAAVTSISPLRRFGWLLRREFWEHRSGLLYAPLAAGLLSLLLVTIAIVLGIMLGRRAQIDGQLNGAAVNINGLDLATLSMQMSPQGHAQLQEAVNVALALGGYWPLLTMAFVVFFYCLSALYDDRRDRSILFWKSLPVSDSATVLSKLVTALLVAPLLALIASMITMVGYLLLLMGAVAWLGGDPVALILQPAAPLSLLVNYLAWLPVYLFWALPCVGWLLLCSAFARRAPFLWAVVPPLLAGALISSSGLLGVLGLSHGQLWLQGIARLLLGTMPGISQIYLGQEISLLGPPTQFWGAFSLPALWIGALFGGVCVILAIVLRRRSDDS